MSNKFFCPLPWNHLMFRSNGKVQACCESYNHGFDMEETLQKTANNKIMKKLRLDMLEPDTVPELCWKCENREKFQNSSVRKFSLNSYPHWNEEAARLSTNEDGSVDNWRMEYLDIRWSNLCNYKCRFCGVQSSNLWLKDAKLLGIQNLDEYNPKTGIAEFNMDWEDFKTHLPYVRKIKLAGGEPTIMPGTYQLLEELIRLENTNISISLVTNGTTIKYGKYDLLEMFSKFKSKSKNKTIQISAEGMGQRHAWARSAKDDWEHIDSNIQQFKKFVNENSNWRLNFHTGISWMNMYHLADMVEHYADTDFIFNIVSDPPEMSIQRFYKKELEKASEFYSQRIRGTNQPLVIEHLTTIKNAIDNALITTKENIKIDLFKQQQRILDGSRNQNFAQAYPEWAHLYA